VVGRALAHEAQGDLRSVTEIVMEKIKQLRKQLQAKHAELRDTYGQRDPLIEEHPVRGAAAARRQTAVISSPGRFNLRLDCPWAGEDRQPIRVQPKLTSGTREQYSANCRANNPPMGTISAIASWLCDRLERLKYEAIRVQKRGSIGVTFSTHCKHLMREFGVTPDQVNIAINNRHRGLVTRGLDRIIAFHWFGVDQIVLVDAAVTQRKDVSSKPKRVRFIQVEARLVLLLRRNLPAGRLTRCGRAQPLLAIVAKSFGIPITGHIDVPPTYLYSGRWDGKAFHFGLQRANVTSAIFASCYRDIGQCDLVWAFDLDRYRGWLAPTLKRESLLLQVPSRAAMEPVVAQIKAYIQNFESNFPNVRPTAEAKRWHLAVMVLQQALGQEWCDRNLINSGTAKAGFQQTGLEGSAAKRAQLRAEQLGELVFNLQAVSGFKSRIALLKHDNLYSAVCELQAAAMLIRSGLKFRFMEPTGKKRRDFEGLFQLPSGRLGACEVKMKAEETRLSERSILESLKSAVKQVPDVPTIIFLALPSGWISQPAELETTMARVCARFFGMSKRTTDVVYFWEEWVESETGRQARLIKFREYHNSHSRYHDALDLHLLKPGILGPGPHWISFGEVVSDRKDANQP
jgi:hypothetical protein